MDGITKDKLPTMITLKQDPYQDLEEDRVLAAKETYAYLLNAPGTINAVYCLMVSDDDIERAKAYWQKS